LPPKCATGQEGEVVHESSAAATKARQNTAHGLRYYKNLTPNSSKLAPTAGTTPLVWIQGIRFGHYTRWTAA